MAGGEQWTRSHMDHAAQSSPQKAIARRHGRLRSVSGGFECGLAHGQWVQGSHVKPTGLDARLDGTLERRGGRFNRRQHVLLLPHQMNSPSGGKISRAHGEESSHLLSSWLDKVSDGIGLREATDKETHRANQVSLGALASFQLHALDRSASPQWTGRSLERRWGPRGGGGQAPLSPTRSAWPIRRQIHG